MTSTTAKRILLIEDHVPTRENLSKLLRHFGYEPTTADSVEQALPLIDGHDALLVDFMLPDGTGGDVIAALRATGHRLPTAVITALDVDYLQRRVPRPRQPDVFFQKPLNLASVLAWLKACA